MLSKYLNILREKNPLVHNITNYVTVNDCANILLAIGASPIMADDIEEVEEITSICNGLNINIGTLNHRTIESMLAAGKKANELGHPVLLDPVGVGASKLRTETARLLLDEVQFSVIRGNVSELKGLFLDESGTRGVDASEVIDESNIKSIAKFAEECSKKSNSIILITGKTDIVSDGERTYLVENGVAEMARITGSGCMLSALITAFISADNSLESVVAGTCVMGIAGEKALETMKKNDAGNSSYRNYLIDEIYKMTGGELGAKSKIIFAG